MSGALDRAVDRGLAWVGATSLVAGLCDLASTLLCVRLWVSMGDFGAATLAIALFPILDRIVSIGPGAAVVTRQDEGGELASTAFWVGLAVAVLVLVALVSARPLLAPLFPRPVVATILCAYAGKLVIQQLAIVPEARLRRDLRYPQLAIIRLAGTMSDNGLKIGLAYLATRGHPWLSVWCFVIGPIVNGLVNGIGVQLCRPWRPRLVFARAQAGYILRFGSSVAASELLYFLYTSADYLVVGHAFGVAAVGAYRLAYELVLNVVRLISQVTAEVAFPAYVRLAADRDAVARQLLRLTRQNLISLTPFLAFVLACAPDLLHLLYPVLGSDAATAVRILLVVGTLRTISFVVAPMLPGIGKPRGTLAYNVCASIVLPAAFVIAARVAPSLGFVAVAWGWAVGYPIAFAFLLALALPEVGLRAGAFLRRHLGILACGLVAFGVAFAVRAVLPDVAILRALATAVVVVAVDLAMLARVEGVTARRVLAGLRGGED